MLVLIGLELVGMREVPDMAGSIIHKTIRRWWLGWEEKDEIHHILLTILLLLCPSEKSSQFPSLPGARAALLGEAGVAPCLAGNLPCTKPIPRSATSC